MVKIFLLVGSIFFLNGCNSIYIPPNKPNDAKVKIINDSNIMSLLLITYEDGDACQGPQLFDIPKEMVKPNEKFKNQVKAGGEFSTMIDADKPFSLLIQGNVEDVNIVGKCIILSTLQPNDNDSYEYHYNYSNESKKCSLDVVSVSNEGIKRPIEVTQLKMREYIASAFNGGSSCK